VRFRIVNDRGNGEKTEMHACNESDWGENNAQSFGRPVVPEFALGAGILGNFDENQ
jgi:hypothetical protein